MPSYSCHTKHSPSHIPRPQVPIMSIYEPHHLDAPVADYGRYFRYRQPLPPVATDTYGIPQHPFWREYYFRQQVDPNSPAPYWGRHYSDPHQRPDIGSFHYPPLNSVSKYYYLLAEYYWLHGLDLRPYRASSTVNRFMLPFPPASVVPRDSDGIPLHLYWMFMHFIIQANPGYPLPPYDAKGEPLEEYAYKKYQHFGSFDFNSLGIDRREYLRTRTSIKMLSRTDMALQSRHAWGLKKQGPVFFPKIIDYPAITPPKVATTLSCPTIDELARAYITVTNPTSLVATPPLLRDTARFPNGFTEEHRTWLIACAPPPILAFLQANLPATDPILVAIMEQHAKPLDGSDLRLV